MLSIFFFYGALSLLALRLVLAAVFLVHGWNKLKDLKGTAAWFSSIGFKPGRLWGTLAAILEFGGGLAFVLGFLVQPIAALLALQFVVILGWRWKSRQPFVGGWELDLVILAALLVLLFLGGGSYSLDRIYLPVI